MDDETLHGLPTEPDDVESDVPAPGDQTPSTDLEWLTVSTAQGEQSPSVAIDEDSSAVFERNPDDQSPALAFPVVGIGGSAGGLQAFRELLENLPEKTGMAYVLISHLSADKPSYLSEILSRSTSMPVHPIEDGEEPQPEHVYVLPPGHLAFLNQGKFHLEHRKVGERMPLAVDTFFRSLAADQQSYAIGVVLSGADSDGTLGVRAIKGEGGVSIAQSPETAQQSSMPLSSIEMDHVDFIGSPAEIAVELARLASLYRKPQIQQLEGGQPLPKQEQSYQRILQILRSATGLDLRQYKQQTVRRRIGRRMVVRRIESLSDYARFLQLRPDEVRALHEDVLINVTRFFRDPEFWHSLSTQVLPILFAARPHEKPLRIWCAGCATGEEAYSVAITVLEYFTANQMDATVQVFGTDASEYAIEAARTALYPESLVAEISPERLRRFFNKVDRGYQMSKRVRDCCIFARQNLCNDPPFSHIDLLSCRNVLIYFSQALQKQLITTFHYALEPDGYLLLGASESLRDYGDLFNAFDRKNKIYGKVEGPARIAHISHALDLMPSSMRRGEHLPLFAEGWSEIELQRAADRIALARYAPPGLIVDDTLKVLQVRGQTTPYVELASGSVSWNLSRVLREEIAAEVKGAVERAIRENIPVAVPTVITRDGERQTIQVEVLPITSSSARSRCFLVLFSSSQESRGNSRGLPFVLNAPSSDANDANLVQARQDLASTQFHLQSLIEERDARNQELVSANEEIQSANEELQSTNEELETTKEELQSTNEELQTVNEELKQRNAALAQTGNDLTNLLNSVNMPLLMLTDNLIIRHFTPPMERLFNIRAADIGRSLSEIRLQLSVENIEPILHEVLDTLGTRELEVQDRDEKWHLLRIRPYRTAENKIDGLVVLLLDIDQLRRSQQDLLDAHNFAASVVQSVPISVVVLEMDCTIRIVNQAFVELTQTKESELTGRSFPDLAGLFWGSNEFKTIFSDITSSGSEKLLEIEHRSTKPPAKMLLIKVKALPLERKGAILLTIEDITVRRQRELLKGQEREQLEKDIEARDQTLLRTETQLRGLAAHLFAVQEEERQRIARELHDDIGQRLSLIEMHCAKAEESDVTELPAIRKEVQALNTDVREISHRLHPAILTDLGISAALKALIDDFRLRRHLPATYSETKVPNGMPQAAQTALYRITQEALRNVSKHAGETHVKVSLEKVGETVRLQVRDFGIGFDQDQEFPVQGLGITSMEERARIAGGTFSITSSLGDGATITVDIPLNPSEQHGETSGLDRR